MKKCKLVVHEAHKLRAWNTQENHVKIRVSGQDFCNMSYVWQVGVLPAYQMPGLEIIVNSMDFNTRIT